MVDHSSHKGHAVMRQQIHGLSGVCVSRVEDVEQALGLIGNMEVCSARIGLDAAMSNA